MRLIVALVFVVGCADGMDVSPPPPDLGQGHGGDGSTVDTGTTPDGGAVCGATVDMLSGRAMYSQGSAHAADRAALSDSQGSTTCGEWSDGMVFTFSDITVTSGTSGNYTMEMVGSSATAGGCAYTLRVTTQYTPTSFCLVTRDYVLTVP